MRDIPAPLADHIEGDALTLATLVKLTRTDGVTMGFTDRDTDIRYQGLTYYAADGMGTTAIQSKAGTGIDNMDVSGFLTSSRITEEDLDGGVYNGARVVVQLVNRAYVRANPNVRSHATLLVGWLGGVQSEDGRFSATVRSLADRLKQTIGETLSPTCRCRCLGDLQCKASLAGNTLQGVPIRATGLVVNSPSLLRIVVGSMGAATGHYSKGTIKFLTGANAGLSRDVKAHVLSGGSAVLDIRNAFPYPVVSGDQALLTAGCDRTFGTCRDKFGNANNFHGEERIPTNDKANQQGR